MQVDIIYQDEELIAVNKPNGLLVHRTRLAANEQKCFAMQIVRDMIGQHVYPIHRLDRPTSGVLLFALSPGIAHELQQQFESNIIQKTYLAVCRGYCPESGEIAEPLTNETTGKLQDAVTVFERLDTIELPIHVSRYPTSRYSLVRVTPKTGRYHQIRKHFAKIRHYLIGDTKHGDLPHNKMFREELGCPNLLLHAWQLQFQHPGSKHEMMLKAILPDHFNAILERFGWKVP